MIKQSLKQINLLLSAFVLALGFTVLWVTPKASAQTGTGTITCTGRSNGTNTPALGPVSQDTTIRLEEHLGVNGGGICKGSPFNGGYAKATFKQQASCLSPPLLGTVLTPDVITYYWNDGKQSTVTFTLTTIVRAANHAVLTSAGTITAGYGYGAAVEREKIVIDINVEECLESNLREQGGPMTFVIKDI